MALFLFLTVGFSELNYRVIEMPLRTYGNRRTTTMRASQGMQPG